MTIIKKNKYDLDTPCLVLDMDIIERNLMKMQTTINHAGKNLRPHAKTHKCSALAMKQIKNGAIGVCAAKVSEAEALIKAGINNILITGPIVTSSKIEKLVELLKTDSSLMVVLDHHKSITMLDNELRKQGMSMDVILDVDVGLNRTGVHPSEALDLAEQIISRSTLCLAGIHRPAGDSDRAAI